MYDWHLFIAIFYSPLICLIDFHRHCQFRLLYLVKCLVLLHAAFATNEHEEREYCRIDNGECAQNTLAFPRYILYDVNQPEGFNLRRDVYIRMATFIQQFESKEHGDWHLVLPPWNRLYHWESEDAADSQIQLFWHLFFDIPSLQAFAPVVEMYDFFRDTNQKLIDNVFILQHHRDLFNTDNANIEWNPRWEPDACSNDIHHRYIKINNGRYKIKLWGYKNLTTKDVQCLSFQGESSLLGDILSKYSPRIAIFDNAEVPLHMDFGNEIYWKCRRSMRFNKALVAVASEYRSNYLDSTDLNDNTIRPDDWRLEMEHRNAIGGPYLAVHLRRKDFIRGHNNTTPSLKSAAEQIEQKLAQLGLSSVFIATDAPVSEYIELKNLLGETKVFRYIPSDSIRWTYKDGGIAIIDQIVCSHARHFIGTCESTFSFRIQEEREILGFKPDTTFNCFCAKSDSKCEQPSRWKIIF